MGINRTKTKPEIAGFQEFTRPKGNFPPILWDHIAWAIQPFFLGMIENRTWILVWYSLAMPSIGVEHKKPY